MAGVNNLYVHSKMSLLEKAAAGKIPVYLIMAHGADYAPSSQSQAVVRVPPNKTLVMPVKLGQALTFEAGERLAKHLASKSRLSNFFTEHVKNRQFEIIKGRQQFPNTVLNFTDDKVWMGIKKLPHAPFAKGISKELHTPYQETRTPHKKRITTFLNENPDEEAVYIIACCRAVKGVPYNLVFPTRTNIPARTLVEKVRLANALKTGSRKSVKRSPEESVHKTGVSKKSKPQSSKKRKRTPSESSRKKQKTRESPVGSLTKKMKSLKI